MLPNKLEAIPETLGSSEVGTQTDDSLKDIDSLLWLPEISEREATEWLTFLRWVRLADRYLERDIFQKPPHNSLYTFRDFVVDWHKIRHGKVADTPHATLFNRLRQRWKKERMTEGDLQIWDLYLESLEKYVRPGLIIVDMRGYERALYGLSGTFFQGFPLAPKKYHEQIGVLGMLDQFFNNLRDLYEDISRGISYFPVTLLEEFGIQKIEEQVTNPDEKWIKLTQYLLTSFVPSLKSRADPMLSLDWINSRECPYSWRCMIQNNLRRYGRITHVLNESGYNGEKFSPAYWDAVRADLPPETRSKFLTFTRTLKLEM